MKNEAIKEKLNIYVAKDASGKLYSGRTTDLDRRMKQHNSTPLNKLSTTRYIAADDCGSSKLTLLSYEEVSYEDGPEAEEKSIIENHCIGENGLNTNHASKNAHKSELGKLLKQYCRRYKNGELHSYSLTSLISWGLAVAEQNNIPFNMDDFIKFIIVGGKKTENGIQIKMDRYIINNFDAGEGFSKEYDFQTVRKKLLTRDESYDEETGVFTTSRAYTPDQITVLTNRYFFTNTSDLSIMKELIHISNKLNVMLDKREAMNRVKKNLATAKHFSQMAAFKDIICEKKRLEGIIKASAVKYTF